MTDDPVGRHCSHRLFEWAMAAAMLGFGLHSLVMPATLSTSRYAAILLLVSGFYFSLACIAIGATRVVALLRNGNWPHWGPKVRAGTALCAAAIWAQLAVALCQPPNGVPSPGMWVYCAIAVAELRSVWRARRDGNGP